MSDMFKIIILIKIKMIIHKEKTVAIKKIELIRVKILDSKLQYIVLILVWASLF